MRTISITRWTTAVGLAATLACAMPSVANAWSATYEWGNQAALAQPSRWMGAGSVCMTAGTDTAQTPVPGCNLGQPDSPGSGAVRLTGTGAGDAGALVFTPRIPITQGADISFFESGWGGTGGDGVTMFLQDGDMPIDLGSAIAGATSSMLGYAPQSGVTTTGLPNGLLAVSADNYGAFESSLADGTGCNPAPVTGAPETVAVRGPGNGAAGYCLDASGGSLGPVSDISRAGSGHLIEVMIQPQPSIDPRIVVLCDGSVLYDAPLTSLVSPGYSGPNITTVHTFRVGFAATNDSAADNHDIWDIGVWPDAAIYLSQSTREQHFTHTGQILHYRFVITNSDYYTVTRLGIGHVHSGTFSFKHLHCSTRSLTQTASTVCTATHRVTRAEMKGGRIRDTLYAHGVGPGGLLYRSQSNGYTITRKR